MSLALNGQIYDKGYIPFYTPSHTGGVSVESSFEYGLGFTADNYMKKEITVGYPNTVQEITIPNYYYTGTDWLKRIGYTNVVNSIIGDKATAQVLVVPHMVPYTVYKGMGELYAKGLYLLAQYHNAKNPSDEFYDLVYNALSSLGVALPLSPDNITRLCFFNDKGGLVPLEQSMVVSLWDTVKSCKFVNEDKSLSTLQFYSPFDFDNEYSNGHSYIDLYIAGYHMRVNYSSNNVYIGVVPNIQDDQYFTDPTCRFWTATNALPIKLIDTSVTNNNPSLSKPIDFGYGFKNSITGHLIGWDAKAGDEIVGKNNTDITFYREDNIGVTASRKIMMNAAPNVYNAIGKQTDNTIGTLPAGAVLNNIGFGNISTAKFPPDYESGGDKNRFYPLGRYHLHKDYTYFYYSGTNSSALASMSQPTYNYIDTYTLDGVVLLQVVYYGNGYQGTNWSRRLWRFGYYVSTTNDAGSISYIPNWSVWFYGEYE